MRRIHLLFVVLMLWAGACASSDSDAVSADSTPTSTTLADTSTTTVADSTTTVAESTTTTNTSLAARIESGRPYTFAKTAFTISDVSRVTPATETAAELPARTLAVDLYLPDREGPAPLIIFSHGFTGHPDKHEDLLGSWAAAGYAVAAPAFPQTNRDAPNPLEGIPDGPNQPGDVLFVLDNLLDKSSVIGSQYVGRFDADRVGAAGHSYGGATTYEAALNGLVRDKRIDAGMIIAGVRFTNLAEGTFVDAQVPAFFLHGDADPLVDLDISRTAFNESTGPAFFVTLLGGGHAGPFEDEGGPEPKIEGMDAVVFDSTIAFWDHYLLDDADAVDRILAAGNVEGISIFEAKNY